MMCKQCDIDDMAWVKDTGEIGNGEGNKEWKIHQKKKPKNQSQNKKNNNKNKHHNQDAEGGKTGTGTPSIMRKGSNYQDGGRGRGGRVDTNQQHVPTTGIRFEDPKPVVHKSKPTKPKPTPRVTEQERQDPSHKLKLKINP